MTMLLRALLALTTTIYDFTTILFYMWWQRRQNAVNKHLQPPPDRIMASVISRSEREVRVRCTLPLSHNHKVLRANHLETMYDIYAFAMRRYEGRRCMGTREVKDMQEEDVVDAGVKKVFKKYLLGDQYLWKTFREVDDIAARFISGLAKRPGIGPDTKICIFAETRAEWLITAIAAFKQSVTIVTLYATLGEDQLRHGLEQTQCEILVTSEELLPKISKLGDTLAKHLKCLVYMEDPLKKSAAQMALRKSASMRNVAFMGFCDVVNLGSSQLIQDRPPKPSDIAIIMYTSGSTGVPKGVLLSHRNIAIAMRGLADALGEVKASDLYIGYLPLAHVLELMCESICFMSGVAIGYSSPLTLTDKGSKLMKGTKGDASVLQPTIMVSVPFALDRIYKGVMEQLNEGGAFKRALFDFFYQYKVKWQRRGFDTPLTNAIIFKRARLIVGGKVRLVIAGGAPLAPDTHEFIRTTLCVPLTQGYGLTETAACTTCSPPWDNSTGRVGPPLRCCDVILSNWEESGYTVSDQPYPRGEIVVGGDNVAEGYFKLSEEENLAAFYSDQEEELADWEGCGGGGGGGRRRRRWFRTGDIAELHPDGALKIIDRKKDLIKLQMGEYVSLGKIEAALKTNPLIDTICVHVDPMKTYCVALVVPNEKQLLLLAPPDMTFEEACRDPGVMAAFDKTIKAYGKDHCMLQKFEIPLRFALLTDIWTPDNNLVTAAFKIRRMNIYRKYEVTIKSLYA